MDEDEKMRQMDAWLDRVCAVLELDRETVRSVQPDLLDLVGEVAHGPSRPGAPLTAFLVGLSCAADGSVPTSVRDRIDRVLGLLAD